MVRKAILKRIFIDEHTYTYSFPRKKLPTTDLDGIDSKDSHFNTIKNCPRKGKIMPGKI